MKVYNAEGKILGRLATMVVEDVLDGEEVRIVNAEKAFITGKKVEILDEYKEKRERGKQRKGPYYPRRPDRIMKRTIRGMLPYQQPRGRKAFKRVRAYVGIPSELEDKEIIEPDVKDSGGRIGLTLGEVSSYLGSKF